MSGGWSRAFAGAEAHGRDVLLLARPHGGLSVDHKDTTAFRLGRLLGQL